MKKVMVDMDNVITNGNIDNLIEDFFDIKINLDEVKEYMYVQYYIEPRKEEFWEYMKDKNMYEDAPLIENCFDVLNKYKDKYDFYIVTSYLWNDTIDLSGINLKNKYYYLREKLPFIKPENYIFTTNKNIINFDIKIDDKLSNLENADTKLLFTQWHNKDISNDELEKDNVIRVNNWKDIDKILGEGVL